MRKLVRAGGVGMRARRAFSLLEIMLVVVIIGILATIVIVNVGGQGERARVNITITRMGQIKDSLTQYQFSAGSYPASLEALTQGSNPLLERIPTDAWNRPFVYYTPSDEAGRPFTLRSAGPDGQLNTPDDINVWTMDQPRTN